MQKLNPNHVKCHVCESQESKIIAKGHDYQYNTVDDEFFWHECNSCGHYFLNPMPSVNDLGIIYPKTLGNYCDFDDKKNFSFKIKKKLDSKRIIKLTESFKTNSRILDVGCGTGTLLDIFKECAHNFSYYEGIEISETAARTAENKGFEIKTGTIEEITLQKNFYDVIFLQQVIEHVHQPKNVIKKLYESLKINGIIVLETPSLNTWDHKLFKKGTWEGYHIPRHFNLWTTKSMKKMINEIGILNLSYNYRIKPVHWTLSLQNLLIKNKKFKSLQNALDLRSKFPILLILFTFVDLLQFLITRKTSDIQYIIKKE